MWIFVNYVSMYLKYVDYYHHLPIALLQTTDMPVMQSNEQKFHKNIPDNLSNTQQLPTD